MDWIFSNDMPIWLQLCQQLRRRIVSGVYPPGSKLPAVRELAAEAGVNPNTMQRALQQLEADGLALANRTSGRLVTEDPAAIASARRRMARELMERFFTALEQLGYSPQEAAQLLKEEGYYA